MAEQDSVRALISAVKQALERFSEVLESGAAPPLEDVVAQAPRPADEHVLGKRQLQIVELPALATEDGLKTADIATAVGYELPNTYSALQALTRNQVIEQVPGREPQHWRLARRYRAASQVYARMAELVRPGEWTTATDVSIAVRGDIQAANAIAAARLSDRILTGGRPQAEAAERLAAEGVVVLPSGEADPRQRITWDELSRRAAAAQERRTHVAKGTLNYLQVPASDLDASAGFYEDVFGWQINRYPSVAPNKDQPQTGYVGFLDSSGKIGGEFVLDRQPSREPGLLPSILVDDIDETLTAVLGHGGEVVKPRTPIVEGSDWQALFRDPAGNVMALYQRAS
jgi:predicted enzyme related to lactoylglutathione lyase